jgi:hypothetical protein
MNTVRLGTVLMLALTAACGGISVTTDWDPSFDFAAPQTFTVLDEASGQPLDRLNDQRVKNSIATVMEAKGFRQVADTSQADLAVGYQFTTEQRSSYQTVDTGWNSYGYGGYGGWYRYGGPMMTTSTTTETRYDVGSLLIAVFDTERRAMVFTSTGSKSLSDAQRSPEEAQRRIDDAVDQILRDFPPGS